jgi:hypothetical protein
MTEDIQADVTAETLRIAQHPRVSPEPTDASA